MLWLRHENLRTAPTMRSITMAVAAIAAFGFIAAAAYISVIIFDRQNALGQVSRYNITWSASQAVSELNRLQTAIARVANPAFDEDPSAVDLRYGIFLNRLELLSEGEFKAFADAVPARADAVQQVKAGVATVDKLIPNIRDASAAREALEVLEPLTTVLIGLAAESNRVGGEAVSADQAELLHLHWEFTILVSGLIGCGLALIGVTIVNNGRLRAAHDALHSATEELKATSISRATLDTALTNMSQGLCMFDADRRLVVSNRRFYTMLNLEPDRATIGTGFGELLAHARDRNFGAAHLLGAQARLMASGQSACIYEQLADGRVMAVLHEPLADGGWLTTYEDVTERKQAEAKITHMARHDALTGLPNRLLFRERLENSLSRISAGGQLAVMCLDLDHFKAVNDTLGHPVGDELLRAVTARLQACVNPVDTVARLGGDEFAIVQPLESQPGSGMALARLILDAMAEPFLVSGHQVAIGVSIGIAIAPNDSEDADSLLKQADLALYRAKSVGRSTFRVFESEMDTDMQLRRALELDLRRALAMEEFEVFYQPLINTRSREITGFEALLRWRHPERGLVLPGEFVGLAEEIGLIDSLGTMALRRACMDAANWSSCLSVAVNVSPLQFRTRDIVASTAEALRLSGLPAERLQLEITETVLLQDTESVIATLHQLRDMGVRISMDDFGTGYSSLSYLRKFPFDKIKIDRSFVGGLGECTESEAIVGAVINLGASLGIQTTVEGVETFEQLAWLERRGCTEVQGFLFGHATSCSQAEELVRDNAKIGGRSEPNLEPVPV